MIHNNSEMTHSNIPPAKKITREEVEGILSPLEPRFLTPLLSMYMGESQRGTDGALYPIDKSTKISPSQGIWLYNFCLDIIPQRTLEIGLAYGYSTIYFMAAAAKNRSGYHLAIDPYQTSHWNGIGYMHARSLVAEDLSFKFIEDFAVQAAVDLKRAEETYDLIFIDGNHRFDDVLVDFSLYAPLCAMGGYIILDDLWMRSIQTVVAYIRANREDFIEIPTDESNIAVFRKIGEDSRNWDHFKTFALVIPKYRTFKT